MKKRKVIKIDEVGRLVIPKEVRNILEFNEKLVQIDLDGDRLIVKKYAPLSKSKELWQNLCNEISLITGKTCLIGDYEKVLFVSGGGYRHLEKKQLSARFKDLIVSNESITVNANQVENTISIVAGEELNCKSTCVVAIKDKDIILAFIALVGFEGVLFSEKEIYCLKVARSLLLSVINHDKN